MLPWVVRPLHWRMARAGKPTPGQAYIGPCGLVALWVRASTLAMLSWGFFLRVLEAATVTPADLTEDKLLGFCSSRIRGFKTSGDRRNPGAQPG